MQYREYRGEIPINTVRAWQNHIMTNTPWQPIGWSGAAKEPYRHWAAYPDIVAEIKTIWDCINVSFKEDGFELVPERAILNLYSHGDSSWLHKDGDLECWTAIVYLNDYWDINWGGETVLVEDDEILKSFAATPGKFVLFRGDILHGCRPVSREAPYPRLGLAFQCGRNLQRV